MVLDEASKRLGKLQGLVDEVYYFKVRNIYAKNKFALHLQAGLQEPRKCWSQEFQLEATFENNFGHSSRQIMFICRLFYRITEIL